MVSRWGVGGASSLMDDSGTSKRRSELVMAPPPASRRLAQAVGSLEAEYAVLSEASATSAALEAMLRNSQPLLWLDNALVLQREKPQAQPPAVIKRIGTVRSRQPLVASAPDGGGDDLLSEDMFLMESELRRRRRIQWEVAKRIARVEREISQQPVTQRSWHVREKKRLQEEEKRRQDELAQREKLQRQQERDEQLRMENEKKVKGKEIKRVALMAREPRDTMVVRQKTNHMNTKPPAKVDVDLDFKWPSKPVTATAARRQPHEDEESESDKENTSSGIQQQPTETEMSPRLPEATTTNKDLESDRLIEIVRESLDTPVPSVPSQSPQKTANAMLGDILSDGDDADSAVQETHPRAREDGPVGGRAVSSLGRQVLSEYRTMATSVSFGARAVAGARLNSDVLRRLFNDLDADRDGHLNRIETCMALYRLHIDVPAPRIVAFFKRIHTVETDTTTVNARRRNQRGNVRVTTHEPLNELISYKQFVAFVTTAFEQQQQRSKQTSHREERPGGFQFALPPLQVPSRLEAASLSPPPSRQPREDPVLRDPRPHRPITLAEEQERRLVEQQGDEEKEDVADRVLRQIPDYLMARALAAADFPPRHVQRIVRQSLEKYGEQRLEDATVEDVARDLVRAYAQKLLSNRQAGGIQDDEDFEDTSGLRRAAAYFDLLGGVQVGGDLPGSENGEEGAMQDWWKVLTEEQVAVLVQDIWWQRQSPAAPVVPTEKHEKENDNQAAVVSPILQSAIPERIMEVSDESAHSVTGTTNVKRVAEKSIQTGSIEFVSSPWQRPPSPLPPPPPPQSPPPEPTISTKPQPLRGEQQATLSVRSTLAQVILASGNLSQQISSHRKPVGSRSRDVLADLRRQRRRRLTTAPVAASMESVSSTTDSLPIIELPPPVTKMPTSGDSKPHQVDRVDPNVTPIEPIEQEIEAAGTTPSPLPVREVRVRPPTQSPLVPSVSIESTSSSHSSSNDVLSSYSSSLGSSMNLFREMSGDDFWRYAAQRRRERLGRRRRHKGERSSRAQASIDIDGDLSEGEIVREKTREDLSDGELFGPTRRKVVRAKNTRTVAELRQSNDSKGAALSVAGSLESGEMLPSMMALHRNYQHRMIRSSASSLESGEAEDGVAVSFDVHGTTR